MLSASHNRAYQDFLTLLTNFKNLVDNPETSSRQSSIMSEFQSLKQCFEQNIVVLDVRQLDPSVIGRWQSVQTEIKRAFKLLTTDILFLASARQDTTQIKRIKSIEDRLNKLIGYCQILLQD